MAFKNQFIMQLERIQLLQFVTSFAIGGTERQVLNLVRGMDTSRFDLHVACLNRSGALLREMENANRSPVEYKTNRLYNYSALRNQFKFARYLKNKSVDVVHTYGFYTNVFAIAAARLAGVPAVIASIRDTGEHLTSAQRQVQKLFCMLADRVVVNADAVRTQLIADGYDPGKLSVIHNGVHLQRYSQPWKGLKLHHEFGFPNASPIIAVIARLNELKGVDHFIGAAALLAAQFDNVRFLIVGDGASRPALELHARRCGIADRVAFAGFRMDVPRILSETTVSVLPTLSEGLSNTLLESMAAGVPVVATRVGGNPEIVRHGETGFLVPPRDPSGTEPAGGPADFVICHDPNVHSAIHLIGIESPGLTSALAIARNVSNLVGEVLN